MDMIAHKF